MANNLLNCFVHAVLPCDYWPRRLFHNFHFWPQISWFVNSARYFFLPSSSICDHQVLTSSDESPGHRIPIRSWVSQTLVFLICTILPRFHQMGFLVIVKRISSQRIEFLNIIISKNNCNWVRKILDRNVGSNDREVLEDQVSDLSSTEEAVFFLSFHFLQTDLILEAEFWMILFSAEAIFASSESNFGIRIPLTEHTYFRPIHWINQLHFFDPQHSFRRKLWTSTYLSLESYLPTSERCWCGKFVKMKIRNLQSLLVGPIILWNLPSLGSNEFLADGPDWHLWSWTGVWRSLVTCGDVCSDTLEIQRFNSCG